MRTNTRSSTWAGLGGLLVLSIAALGCRANLAPVLNIANAPAASSSGIALTTEDVRAAILRALAAKTWTLVQEAPGAITASVGTDPLVARAVIQYTHSTFSITYLDSTPGLGYDGRVIHRRYNHWVDRLRNAISSEMRRAPFRPAAPAAPAAQPA